MPAKEHGHIVYQSYCTHFTGESQLLFCPQIDGKNPSPEGGFLVHLINKYLLPFSGKFKHLGIKNTGMQSIPVKNSKIRGKDRQSGTKQR